MHFSGGQQDEVGHMQIEVGTAGYSSKIVMQSGLGMDFASCECLTCGLSGMCISSGYFQFHCSD